MPESPPRAGRWHRFTSSNEGDTMNNVKRITRWIDTYTLWAFNAGRHR